MDKKEAACKGVHRLQYLILSIRIKNGVIEKDEFDFYNNQSKRKGSEALAEKFYNIADDNSGNTSMQKMQTLLDKNVNKDNVVAFLDAYDRDNTKRKDSSIIDTVTSEICGEKATQKRVLTTILETLCKAAKDAGVSDEDIEKARSDFNASIKEEYDFLSGKFRRTNPLKMENAINFLRGVIVAKQTDNVGEISDKQAIKKFNESFSTENNTAQTQYKEAREQEGWAASVGDTVCGWFGCKTVEEMDAKLGKNAESVKKLASAKTKQNLKFFIKRFSVLSLIRIKLRHAMWL